MDTTTTREHEAPKPVREAGVPRTSPVDFLNFSIIEFKKRERLNAADGDAAADAAGEDSPRTYRIVLSTDRVIDRGYAKLTFVHEKSAVDWSYAKNGLSLLVEHGARTADQMMFGLIDPDLHVGCIENIEIVGNRLEGDARFSDSALAQQIERDVATGIRKFISAAIQKLKWKLTKAAASPDEADEYLVTKWMPLEGSVVSIPANPQAVVKNSAGVQEYPVELESDTPEPEVIQMSKTNETTPTPTVEAPALPTVDRHALGGGQAAIDAAVQANNKRVSDIVELCQSQGYGAKATEYIQSGLTVDQAAHEILKLKASKGELRGVSEEVRRNLPLADRKRWSLRRALDQLCRRAEGKGDFDGVEAEVHQFVEKHAIAAGVQPNGGMFLPMAITDQTERFAMVSNQAGKGAELVFDQPAGLIEVLRNASVCQRMGATVLGDLVGQVPFARQNGDVTVFFVGENPASDVTESDAATGIVTLVGKTMQGATRLSRQLLRTASYDADLMIQNSFGAGHSLAFDRQGLHGTGAAGQCLGVYSAPDVNAIPFGGNPTWDKVIDMISNVGTANAHNGKLGFVSTYGLAGRMKKTLKQSAVEGFIWNGRIDGGDIDGYQAIASNQASSQLGGGAEHALVFGNWAEMIFGLWGGLEVVVDPYTLAGKGLIKFTSFQMGDVILRHGQSFSKATGATA